LPRCGGKQIETPHHIRDTLVGIIYDYRQLVRKRTVSAAQDKVPD
jgi:hypothetical protein